MNIKQNTLLLCFLSFFCCAALTIVYIFTHPYYTNVVRRAVHTYFTLILVLLFFFSVPGVASIDAPRTKFRALVSLDAFTELDALV